MGYHAFGTGISRKQWYPPLATGIYVHQALEYLLKDAKASKTLASKADVQTLIDPILFEYRDTASRVGFVQSKMDQGDASTASEMVETQVSLVEALTHGYARIVLPWLLKNYSLENIEGEENEILSTDPQIRYMARPDFVTRDDNGKLAVHDFKSTAYWNDDQVDSWSDSIQMMVNAEMIGRRLGEPVDHYYIHLLVKGTRRSPSCLTHPFFKPGVPPHTTDSWAPAGRVLDASGRWHSVGKGFTRTPVRLHKPVRDWVWEMPEGDCAKQFIVAGPYDVHHGKVAQFFRGVPAEETYWIENTKDLDWSKWDTEEFQHILDSRFPRTFSCYTYGSRCPMYELCFKFPGWTTPFSDKYVTRLPHHPQEGEDA